MVNPTIEEAGHYFPNLGKCIICNEWHGMHTKDEADDHDGKYLEWIVKLDGMKKKLNVKEMREYYKNIPPIKGTPEAQCYLKMSNKQRRELQQERKNRKDQQSYDKTKEIL